MALSWLRFWRRRRASSLTHLHVRLYTRGGCHLCDTAWRQLQEAQRQWRFTLDAVDVDTDANLVKLYGECVPVVTVDGKVRFRGTINEVLLSRLLSAEADRPS